MPQIKWPTRRIQAGNLSLGNTGSTFSVSASDANAMAIGAKVTLIDGNDRSVAYVTLASGAGYRLASNEDLTSIVNPVPASFVLEKEVGLIVNHTRRPMLADPGVQVNRSVTNPTQVAGWTISAPRFEGSVTIDTPDNEDVQIVEAFVDQLYDPEAWFELPLPGLHLKAQNVTAYSDGDITIPDAGAIADTNLQGWFGRVGIRTIRVVSDERDGTNHVIKIVPALITGTTAEAQSNSFANHVTVRARATSVAATGDPDFGGSWAIEWEETDGD